mgnify:CR=1
MLGFIYSVISVVCALLGALTIGVFFSNILDNRIRDEASRCLRGELTRHFRLVLPGTIKVYFNLTHAIILKT